MKKCLLMRMLNFEKMCADVQDFSSETKNKKKQHGACQVCSDQAAGTYFGAKVCIPCKAFFIRSTSEKTSIFECPGDRRCNISVHTRTACKFCRFQKCLKAGMTRKERIADNNNSQLICAICGDEANGVHFGALTCEGCKKFYRRGMLIGEAKSYVCKANKNCEITARTRNNCRYCRFQKCIQMGMSRDAIQMGRPSRYQKPKVLKNPLTIMEEKARRETSDGENSRGSSYAEQSSTPLTPPSAQSQQSFAEPHPPPHEPVTSNFQSPPLPSKSTSYASLLGESLAVCHTDMTSIGIGQSSTNHPEGPPTMLDNFLGHSLHGQSPKVTMVDLTDLKFSPIHSELEATNAPNMLSHHNSPEPANAELCPSIPHDIIDNHHHQLMVEDLQSHHSQDYHVPSGSIKTELDDPAYNSSHYSTHVMQPASHELFDESPKPDLSPLLPMNWPNCLSPTKDEVDRMFRWGYWDKQTGSSDQILLEEHQALIDHLVTYYKESMQQTRTANEMMRKDLEMLWKDPGHLSLPAPVLIKQGIARYVQAAMIFFVNVPGFQSFSKRDQLFLVRNCSSQYRILMAAINWYDPVNRKFTNNFYQDPPPPERLDFVLHQHIFELAQKIHTMSIDSIEEALLSALVLVAGDYNDLEDVQTIEEIRKTYLVVLGAYTTAKYGSNNSRIEELFRLIPLLRVIGMIHSLLSRGVILGPSRSLSGVPSQDSAGSNRSVPLKFCAPSFGSLEEDETSAHSSSNDFHNLLGLDMAACL